LTPSLNPRVDLALAVAFDQIGLREVVSFTSTVNGQSQAVMRRLGMTHDPADDFDHPRVPPGSPLRRHVLYRLTSVAGGPKWMNGRRLVTVEGPDEPRTCSRSPKGVATGVAGPAAGSAPAD
jgi:hypothetical protein